MTKKETPPSLEDLIQGVHRTAKTNRVPLKQRQPATKKPVLQTETSEKKYHRTYETSDTHMPLTGAESIFFAKSGLQKRLLKKFTSGEYRYTAVLDIHGYTSDIACQKVDHFIHAEIHNPQHCVLIIHGKGYRSEASHPVLKNYLVQWLKQMPEVLAFCSAKPKDGGTGAVYVLLRSGIVND